jgi:hypothetical protein
MPYDRGKRRPHMAHATKTVRNPVQTTRAILEAAAVAVLKDARMYTSRCITLIDGDGDGDEHRLARINAGKPGLSGFGAQGALAIAAAILEILADEKRYNEFTDWLARFSAASRYYRGSSDNEQRHTIEAFARGEDAVEWASFHDDHCIEQSDLEDYAREDEEQDDE